MDGTRCVHTEQLVMRKNENRNNANPITFARHLLPQIPHHQHFLRSHSLAPRSGHLHSRTTATSPRQLPTVPSSELDVEEGGLRHSHLQQREGNVFSSNLSWLYLSS
jgi:hypothetical protein